MSSKRLLIIAPTFFLIISSCTPKSPIDARSMVTDTQLPATKTSLPPTTTPVSPTATLRPTTALASTSPPVDQPVVSIPQGQSPVIDGTISPGEWEGSKVETFADGSELLLLQNEGYLYLAIRANTTEMIVGNVFINRGDRIAILHASAALGTAIYQQDAESWQQIQEFDWCCRDINNGTNAQVERDAFFQEERWVAVNSRVGTPNELEYKIEFDNDPLYLAVNYLTVSSKPNDEKSAWPSLVDDDVRKPTPGGLPMQFHFSPDKWAKLDF